MKINAKGPDFVELDYTPMIDMTFQLIAFFMILINFSDAEVDDRVRGQFLALEQQWQHVAKSYEFIETLEQFLRASHAVPPDVEELPKDFPPE